MKFMSGTQDIEFCQLENLYHDRITLDSFIKELAVSTAFCFGPMGVLNPVDYDQLHERLVFIVLPDSSSGILLRLRVFPTRIG
jgi:hypothetical protein